MAAHMIQFALVIQHRSSCFAYEYEYDALFYICTLHLT